MLLRGENPCTRNLKSSLPSAKHPCKRSRRATRRRFCNLWVWSKKSRSANTSRDRRRSILKRTNTAWKQLTGKRAITGSNTAPLRSATRNLPALKPFWRRKKAWRATQRQRRRIRRTAKRTCNSMCPRAPPAYGYASSKYWPGYTGLAASSPQFTPASRSAEPRPCSPTIITSIKTPSTLWRFWRWP